MAVAWSPLVEPVGTPSKHAFRLGSVIDPRGFGSPGLVTAVDPAAPEPRVPGPYRVLKVAPTSFFADYGCHVRILEEALALKRLGTDVRICTYPAGRDLDGVQIVRSLGLPRGGEIRVGSSRHKLYLDAFLTSAAFRQAVAYQPDIIHGHLHEGALIGLAVARAFRRPLVFDFQGSLTSEMIDHGFLSPTSRLYQPLRWIERTVSQMSDMVITSSVAASDLLVKEFDCDPSKVVPVPDAVDTEVFRPVWEVDAIEQYKIRSALGVPPGRRVVVYLGLLAEYQGSGHLLRAATRVLQQRANVHFLLMGYPGEDRYRALARTLGIEGSVTFTGRVPYERAPRYLLAGDIAVAPKLSATEANGKLLNYMALGLPTVAFDTVVNRDILGPAGMFARMADEVDLARRLVECLDNEPESRDRGRALRERTVAKFSWSAAARQILEIYRHVAGR
jgi:glycosyltransferase involved in cell wall biosynthesis